MAETNRVRSARRAGLLLASGMLLGAICGTAFANPGMGGMGGGSSPSAKSGGGCGGGCGGGGDSDPAARQQASQDAGKRAKSAGNDGNISISSGGGAMPGTVSSGDIAQLGAAEAANSAPTAKDTALADAAAYRQKLIDDAHRAAANNRQQLANGLQSPPTGGGTDAAAAQAAYRQKLIDDAHRAAANNRQQLVNGLQSPPIATSLTSPAPVATPP